VLRNPTIALPWTDLGPPNKENGIFPRTFGVVLMIVGEIWIVQGAGLAPTGSFMDGERVWAVLGALMLLAGIVSVVVQRRRNKPQDPDQPSI
jgi:predicted phage tail protein